MSYAVAVCGASFLFLVPPKHELGQALSGETRKNDSSLSLFLVLFFAVVMPEWTPDGRFRFDLAFTLEKVAIRGLRRCLVEQASACRPGDGRSSGSARVELVH